MVATLTKSKTISAANEQFKYHFHVAFSPELKTHNFKSPWTKKNKKKPTTPKQTPKQNKTKKSRFHPFV